VPVLDDTGPRSDSVLSGRYEACVSLSDRNVESTVCACECVSRVVLWCTVVGRGVSPDIFFGGARGFFERMNVRGRGWFGCYLVRVTVGQSIWEGERVVGWKEKEGKVRFEARKMLSGLCFVISVSCDQAGW